MAFPADYSKYQEITIDSTKVSADLTDFIIYVDLAHLSKAGADIFDTCRTDGGDIRVTKNDGTTELAREVVSIDTSAKTGELHIKYTGTLSSTIDTVIRIYYNGVDTEPAVSATYGRNAVWADYWGVWHFQGAAGTSEKVADSTGNSRNWTENNSPSASIDKFGTVDGAYDMTGASTATSLTSLDYLSMPSVMSQIGSNQFTFSIWFRPHISHSTTVALFREEDNGPTGRRNFGMWLDTANRIYAGYSPTTTNTYATPTTINTVTTNQWSYGVFRRLVTTYYPSVTLNEGAKTSGSTGASTAFAAGNNSFFLNRRYNSTYSRSQRYMDGDYGELRMRFTDVGDSWVTTEYNNQSNAATFYSTSDELGALTTFEVDINENLSVGEYAYASQFLFGPETFESADALPRDFNSYADYDAASSAIDTTSKVNGANSLRYVSTGEGGSIVGRGLASEYSSLFVRFSGFLPSGFAFGPSSYIGFLKGKDGSGTESFRFNIEDYSTVRLSVNGDAIGYTNTAIDLPVNAVFTIQMHVVKHGTTGRVKVWLNNDNPSAPNYDSGDINSGTVGIQTIEFGKYYTPEAVSDYYLDDFIIDDEFIYPSVTFEVDVNDSIIISENVNASSSIFVSLVEVLSISESVTSLLDVGNFVSTNDSLLIAEDTSFAVTHFVSVSDALSIIEDVTTSITSFSSVFETLSVAEQTNQEIALFVNVNDSISVTENVTSEKTDNVFISVSDSVTLGEQADVTLSTFLDIFDTILVEEFIPDLAERMVSVFDEVVVSDAAETFSTNPLSVFDSLTTGETVALEKLNEVFLFETLSVEEILQRFQNIEITVTEIVPITEQATVDFFLPISVYEELLSADQVMGGDVYIPSLQTAQRRPRTGVANPTRRPIGTI